MVVDRAVVASLLVAKMLRQVRLDRTVHRESPLLLRRKVLSVAHSATNAASCLAASARLSAVPVR